MAKINSEFPFKIDHNKIQRLRIAHGISLNQLSQQIDVGRSTLYVFENKPGLAVSFELVIRYCDYFGVSILEIMHEECVKKYSERMADYLLFHEVIDEGTATSIKNFYAKSTGPAKTSQHRS